MSARLTTAQASAFVELQRRGSLRPSSRAWSKYDGSRMFARRTLQALVDAGFADWRLAVRDTRRGPESYDGFVTLSKSALSGLADKAYDREDQDWFNARWTTELVTLWEIACDGATWPAWDDEVYDALAERNHFTSSTARWSQ